MVLFCRVSNSMQSSLISWIRPLHYIWQIFGFTYFYDGLLIRFFESLYFLLVLITSFSCLNLIETKLTQLIPSLFDVRLIVMSIATQWHEVYPVVNLIRYSERLPTYALCIMIIQGVWPCQYWSVEFYLPTTNSVLSKFTIIATYIVRCREGSSFSMARFMMIVTRVGSLYHQMSGATLFLDLDLLKCH